MTTIGRVVGYLYDRDRHTELRTCPECAAVVAAGGRTDDLAIHEQWHRSLRPETPAEG